MVIHIQAFKHIRGNYLGTHVPKHLICTFSNNLLKCDLLILGVLCTVKFIMGVKKRKEGKIAVRTSTSFFPPKNGAIGHSTLFQIRLPEYCTFGGDSKLEKQPTSYTYPGHCTAIHCYVTLTLRE